MLRGLLCASARSGRLALAAAALTVACGPAFGAPGANRAPAGVHPLAYADPGVYPLGDAGNYGMPTATLWEPVTAMASTPDGKGYWLASADGGVFAYGDAGYYGSLGALRIWGPIVSIASTPDGKGYWLAALDGGVFAFGDAGFYGSMGGKPLAEPIVAMTPTPDGAGYLLAAADGGVFAFGDAGYYGSMGGKPLDSGVTGIVGTHDGGGYWLVAGDGGVFTFGDARFLGSMAGKPSSAIVGMAALASGTGYWLAGNDGNVYPFGSAAFLGSTSSTVPISPVTAITATPDGKGYWLLQPDDWSYSFVGDPPSTTAVSAGAVAGAAARVEGDPDAGQGAYCNPFGPCEPWCALFVTWVWRQAGVPVPSYPFTGSIFTWTAAHGVLLPPTAVAAPGDALLYGTGPTNTATSVHTGIVAQVWPDGAVITIEGDAGPAPSGQLAVVVNGPFLPQDSAAYNGFPVYAIAQPVR